MSVLSRINNDVLEIRVSGRIDSSMYKSFTEISNQGTGLKDAVIDMQEAEYIDSSGLGMLLLLREKMGGESASISITNANETIKKIMKIANFQTMFTIN